MLNSKQKKDIYGLLSQRFQKEVDIPLASVALYLTECKVDYRKSGYKKMKPLLEDLGFLELKTSKEEGKGNVNAILHSFEWNKKEKMKEQHKESDSQQILSKLSQVFSYEKEVKFEDVEKELKKRKISYSDFGYTNIKDFLKSFADQVSFSIHIGTGKKQERYVTFHRPVKETAKKKKDLLNVDHLSRLPAVHLATDSPLNAKVPVPPVKKQEKKPVQKKQENKGIVYPDLKAKEVHLPDSLCLSIKDFTDLGLDNNSLKERLLKDYRTARNNHSVQKRDDCLIFPLSFLSKDKEMLIASFKRADSKSGFQYFVNFLGADRDKPKDALKNEVHFSNYEESIKELALLAHRENWCYRHSKDPYVILKIYLQYTYYRLLSQNLISFDPKSGFACFNTGLKTESYEDIYGVLLLSKDKNIKEKYLFQGFSVSASQGLGKIIIEHFNPLPKKASYLQDFSQLFFDTSKEIHTDEHHILLDNIDRFPLEYLAAMTAPFQDAKKIVDAIRKSKNDLEKEKLYRKLEEAINKNSLLYNLLKTSLDSTIDKATRMVDYDYRMALPSFFPTRNVISMMLPLEFTVGAGVEAVLLIEKTTSGNYQGQTILTPKQAYVNARLLSPLEHTYLDPSKIEN